MASARAERDFSWSSAASGIRAACRCADASSARARFKWSDTSLHNRSASAFTVGSVPVGTWLLLSGTDLAKNPYLTARIFPLLTAEYCLNKSIKVEHQAAGPDQVAIFFRTRPIT